MFARIGTIAHRFVLLPVLLFIAAVAFFVTSPSAARAATSLDSIAVGCSSVTFTFTTTNSAGSDLHSHGYALPGYDELISDTSNHDVYISGPGTITYTFVYSTPQADGTSIEFDFHFDDDDNAQVVDGIYVCSDTAPQGPGFTDNRINGLFGDDEAVIYTESDDAGNPAIHVYCINSSGLGYLGLVVTQADLAGIAATPAQNTLAKSSTECRIDFYVLTDGSYQINIGDDQEGKTYVVNGTGMMLDNREYYVVPAG